MPEQAMQMRHPRLSEAQVGLLSPHSTQFAPAISFSSRISHSRDCDDVCVCGSGDGGDVLLQISVEADVKAVGV